MQEAHEGPAARSQHVVHAVARDLHEGVRLLRAPLERARSASGATRMLLLLPSEDELLAVNLALRQELPDLPVPLPLFPGPRSERLCTLRPAAVAGTPSRLLALLGRGVLELAQVGELAILWLDELLEGSERQALEAVLAEVPREAARLAVVSNLTPQVEEFLERAFWRARRLTHHRPIEPQPEPLRYVAVVPEQRGAVLRQLLDIFDDQPTTIVVFSEDEARAARLAVEALGYPAGSDIPNVQLGLPRAPLELLILFEVPPTVEALREAWMLGRNVVVLVPPARLPWLRSSVPSLRPLALPEAIERSRVSLNQLRQQLRERLLERRYEPYLLALEPLFAEFDPAEVAAAAFQALRQEEQRGERRAEPERERELPLGSSGERVRIFLGVGERDGVRPADIVGAIAGECGIAGNRIGRIELRPGHSVVEVDTAVAPLVLERLAGAAIRGRRVVPRLERQPVGRRQG